MRLNLVNINLLLLLLVVSLLTACDSNSNSNITNYPLNTIVVLDEPLNSDLSANALEESHSVNQSIDLLLHYPFDTVSNISWQQSAGEQVTILARNSKVVSFTPLSAGMYSFTVSFSLNDGPSQTQEKSITVTGNLHKVTARLSHSALANNKVSFRSEIDDSIDITTLKWQQIEGPSVTLTADNSDGELAIFFDAPSVDFDTLVTFNVSATDTESNINFSDQVAVLIEPAPSISDKAYFSDRVASVFAYNPESPYADNLVTCVYSNQLSSSCTLAQTPLLAEEVNGATAIPTIESIMDRVVVSHRWMGDRFKDFLTNNDANNDIKNLLRATTAIVIAYDVRPSFYWAATGAIYLDAENFWLTPQERDTINEAPDFRADFGNDLQFVMPWRYVKDNNYASNSYSKSARINRTAEEALYRLTSLLYHELAHANDFFPSNEWYAHNSNQRVYDAAVSTNFESDKLAISLPLDSQQMRDLAQVSFAGETANQTQRAYLPTDIEGFFSPDSATDFYAYSSEREDYAMLFEELMMQNRFGVMRDVAITNQPTGNAISGSDYIVTWGQRGRIGDDKLRDRVLFSASRVLPEFDSQAAMALVYKPIEMIEGDNWVENLTISPVATPRTHQSMHVRNAVVSTVIKKVAINTDNRYYQKPLPKH
jgi:hypothetical protein